MNLSHVRSQRFVSRLFQDVVAATAGLEELKQSTKFARILELILLVGNYMNAGSRNAQSIGFELSFITKVRCFFKPYSIILYFVFFRGSKIKTHYAE